MKSKPQKLEKGTFDDQLRYLLKKYSGLELRKAITTLCEEEVRRARLDELSKFEYNWGGGRDTGDIHRALVKRCEELGK